MHNNTAAVAEFRTAVAALEGVEVAPAAASNALDAACRIIDGPQPDVTAFRAAAARFADADNDEAALDAAQEAVDAALRYFDAIRP
ncbi:hypothetical protein [Prescottella equi]|uniref:hypothetical protein n=1 Tax=Rhodococcus hoagii TaxID=43767 RepID=UPI000D10AE6F|nr:hypothetical protein [Prescottella equi]AVP71293.1 hypothetical protein C7H75_24740 [Prescottella equi]